MNAKSLTCKSWFVSASLLIILFISAIGISAQTTFPANAASLGAIPDSNVTTTTCGNDSTAYRDVTFTVSGLTGNVSAVAVNFNASHTYINDVEATLVAPNATRLLLFGRTGANAAAACNSASGANFIGNGVLSSANTYTFSDSATANWWTTATGPTGFIIPTSTNRTVIAGGAGIANPPAVTSLNMTFANLTPAQANGTWTLRFRDQGVGDTGTVTAANLVITAVARKAPLDFNADGKTDYSVIRDSGIASFSNPVILKGEGTRRDKGRMIAERSQLIREQSFSPEAANKLSWYNLINGAPSGLQWGTIADTAVSGDFDGDSKNDYAVWRPDAPGVAAFYILRSATSTVQIERFGQSGDDPTIVADYDGDGKTDVAVFRSDGTPTGQNFFYYRGSLNNPTGAVTYVQWGFGVNDYPYPGDFDGDGKTDIAIQRDNPTNPDTFIVRKSSGGVDWVNWGDAFNLTVPGDYDGDGKTDYCTTSISNNRYVFNILKSGGGVDVVQFGLSSTYIVPGDYDGDGKTDIAVWDFTTGIFYVRQSSNGATVATRWGASTDVPVANLNVY